MIVSQALVVFKVMVSLPATSAMVTKAYVNDLPVLSDVGVVPNLGVVYCALTIFTTDINDSMNSIFFIFFIMLFFYGINVVYKTH